MSQSVIFGFGVAVFFLGGLGLVLIGLDSFHALSRGDRAAGAPAFRAAERERAEARREEGGGRRADASGRD